MFVLLWKHIVRIYYSHLHLGWWVITFLPNSAPLVLLLDRQLCPSSYQLGLVSFYRGVCYSVEILDHSNTRGARPSMFLLSASLVGALSVSTAAIAPSRAARQISVFVVLSAHLAVHVVSKRFIRFRC